MYWKKFASLTYIDCLTSRAYSCIKGRRPPETGKLYFDTESPKKGDKYVRKEKS